MSNRPYQIFENMPQSFQVATSKRASADFKHACGVFVADMATEEKFKSFQDLVSFGIKARRPTFYVPSLEVRADNEIFLAKNELLWPKLKSRISMAMKFWNSQKAPRKFDTRRLFSELQQNLVFSISHWRGY